MYMRSGKDIVLGPSDEGDYLDFFEELREECQEIKNPDIRQFTEILFILLEMQIYQKEKHHREIMEILSCFGED